MRRVFVEEITLLLHMVSLSLDLCPIFFKNFRGKDFQYFILSLLTN
jgi:hypothetical protein